MRKGIAKRGGLAFESIQRGERAFSLHSANFRSSGSITGDIYGDGWEIRPENKARTMSQSKALHHLSLVEDYITSTNA